MVGRSTFFKLVISGILVFGVGVVVLNFISYSRRQTDLELVDENNAYVPSNRNGDSPIMIKADVKSSNKPPLLLADDGTNKIPKVRVKIHTITIGQDQDQKVLVRQAGDTAFSVVLLHGQAFSSKKWQDIGTIQYLTQWGYRAIAIDLPGYGNSSLPVVEDKATVQWLTRLIRTLRLTNFVLISPSMSGRFAIPYVMHAVTSKQLRGFVPIAPVGTEKFDSADYKRINIPTLIVYGENDTKFRPAIETLKTIPTSNILTIKNASHACYIQRPVEFHNGLRQFLYSVYRPIYVEKNKKRSVSTESSSLMSSLKWNTMTKDVRYKEHKRKNFTQTTKQNKKRQQQQQHTD